ncbi:MAG: sensor histidine kinase [Mangrovibacterium sp.]
MEPTNTEKYQKLQKEHAILEQQNKLNNKLLYMIGHDLRSPLGSIKMTLDLIDQRILDPKSEDFSAMLPELSDAADDAFYLLENLLYWTRIQTNRVSYRPENYPLKQLMDKAVTNMKRSFLKKEINLNNQLDWNGKVYGDDYLLMVIFRNILSNACKFSRKGTGVTLRVADSPEGTVCICISDQGQGISQENMEKVYDPNQLFTTYGTGNENGNGLGLKICESLVKINQGKMHIESREGEGTTVSLTLPDENRQQIN